MTKYASFFGRGIFIVTCLIVSVYMVIAYMWVHSSGNINLRQFLPRGDFDMDIFDPSVYVAPESPLVLRDIRNYFLIPPSPQNFSVDGDIRFPNAYHSDTYDVITSILNSKRNGFFIECGANDGQYISNTLELEAKLNWSGLLIEASPSLFQELRDLRRNSWLANVCISRRPQKIKFLRWKTLSNEWSDGVGKLDPYDPRSQLADNYVYSKEYNFNLGDYVSEGLVTCFPLYSILKALEWTYIDYFSLDVEGHEFKVLETFPFDKVFIKVIQVEYWITPEGKENISNVLVKNGYKLVMDNEVARHFIYVRDD